MLIYVNITDRRTDGQTDRQTDRQTHQKYSSEPHKIKHDLTVKMSNRNSVIFELFGLSFGSWKVFVSQKVDFFLHGLVGNLILEKNRDKKVSELSRFSGYFGFTRSPDFRKKKNFFFVFFFRILKHVLKVFFDILFFVIKELSHPKKIWFVIPIIAHNMNNTNV